MVRSGGVLLCCAIAAVIACTGGVPNVGDCTLLIVDMPHGEWRIHVRRDGSGTYGYGALPATGRFDAAFDFPELHAQLASTVTRAPRESGDPYGTAQFCVAPGECEPLWYFYDRELAAELFDSAWAHRSAPSNELEERAFQSIDRFWAQRAPN